MILKQERSEANCLATYELENFEFLFGMIIWYELLFAINTVSKIMQTEDMHIDVAIRELGKLISYIQKYRETGFEQALITTKEISSEMKIEAVFHEKRNIRKRNILMTVTIV